MNANSDTPYELLQQRQRILTNILKNADFSLISTTDLARIHDDLLVSGMLLREQS